MTVLYLWRRRQSNRESARRTRQRRNNEIHGLREANEALRGANEAMSQQVADLQAANRMLLQSLPAIGEQRRCGLHRCAPALAPLFPRRHPVVLSVAPSWF